MRFTKMEGLGNDYLYVYGEVPEDIKDLSIKLSERHFGAGSDGMIYINASKKADFSMRIFNADGSEAKMCGNGIRCVGKYVYERGYTDKTVLSIETQSGTKTLYLHVTNGVVESVTVDMGRAIVQEDIDLGMHNLIATPVSTGNPHAVIFTNDVENISLSIIGPQVEHHKVFTGGVNCEFVQVLGERELRMRVWERGSGITMACGTGASASTAAAVTKGYCPYDTPIKVHLDGGTLTITVDRQCNVMMKGPCSFVYEGETL